MKYHSPLILLPLLTLTFVGCSKSPGPATDGKLGVVNLSDGIETERDLGDGKVCHIKPAVLADGSVFLEMHIMADGKELASPRMQTRPDQVVRVTVGDLSVELTPHIVK